MVSARSPIMTGRYSLLPPLLFDTLALESILRHPWPGQGQACTGPPAAGVWSTFFTFYTRNKAHEVGNTSLDNINET